MNEVLLHQNTRQRIDSYLAHPSHALCLLGGEGAGKLFIATHIAKSLLGTRFSIGDTTFIISPEKNGIPIEAVRKIKDILRLKKPGQEAIRRVLIIQDIHTMREEAQNALLKTIEEPPSDTVIILTLRDKESILPTIMSRVSPIDVLPISLNKAQEFYTAEVSVSVEKAHNLSGGHAGLLHALLHGTDHPLVASMEVAKHILKETRYERLKRVEELRSSPEDVWNILYCMKRLTSYMIYQRQQQSLATLQREILQAEADLLKRVQTRLILTDLFVKM